MLRIIQKGVPPDWVPIDGPTQTRHLKWAHKVEAVRRMLQKYSQSLHASNPRMIEGKSLRLIFEALGAICANYPDESV